MTHPKTLLLLAAVASLGGCKSGPEKVCDAIDELAAKAMAEGDERAKENARSTMAESSACLTRMQTIEQKDPAAFAKAAACVEEASEIGQVTPCFFQATFGANGKGDGKGDGKAPEPAPAK